MPKPFKTQLNMRIPKRKGEDRNEQWMKAYKGLVACRDCPQMYFNKKWHDSKENLAVQERLRTHGKKFVVCPACKMVKGKQYEGEVAVNNVPLAFSKELELLIKGFDRRARLRDSQDAIIAIQKNKKGYRILTTENQLAVRLSKKIRDVFRNKVDISISYASEPSEYVKVSVVFK